MPRAKKPAPKKRGPKPLADRSLVRTIKIGVPVSAAEYAKLRDGAGDTPIATWLRELGLAAANF